MNAFATGKFRRTKHEMKQSHSARLLGNISPPMRTKNGEQPSTNGRNLVGRGSVSVFPAGFPNKYWVRVVTVDQITSTEQLILWKWTIVVPSLLCLFLVVLLKHSLLEQEKCLPTRTMFAICIRQSISRARDILSTESLIVHRTRTALVSSHIKQEPSSTRIGATKLLLVFAPSIYIGGWLGKNLAEFLEEWSIFCPECDDDEYDWDHRQVVLISLVKL